VRGSYAGAIGIPQFMPGSYLRYAVDFDRDGATDLRANAADAIGSVANFLRRHGWQPGEPVQLRVRVNGEDHAPFVSLDPTPRHTLLELGQAGVQANNGALPAETRAVLLRLQTPERPADYRLGLQNFYVLTRYNRSLFYGMSVTELADELRAARRKPRAGASN
jgi:membrane-bound lytic murein transglycosylase B